MEPGLVGAYLRPDRGGILMTTPAATLAGVPDRQRDIAFLVEEEMRLREEYERIPRRRAEIAAELVGYGLTQQQVADLMGLTKQRVSAMLKTRD